MALKPTIYKVTISLSNIDKHYYDTLNLTLAQHPSETTERMMARLLAYCLHASEQLAFTTGLSTPDEPDIWERSLDDQLLLWIDVGEPPFDRIKKASHIAKAVKVFTFNSKSDVWWQQEQPKLSTLPIEVMQFPWEAMQTMASFVERTMALSITVSEGSLFVSLEKGEVEVVCKVLKE